MMGINCTSQNAFNQSARLLFFREDALKYLCKAT